MPSYMAEWPTWAKMLAARFGLPRNFEVTAWEEALRADIPNHGEVELIDCLAWMQTRGQNWKAPQTVADLRMALYTYRKTLRAERDGYRPNDPAAFVGAVKAAMLKAESWAERWDIMCSPTLAGLGRDTTAAECDELDAWAAGRWPDWAEQSAAARRAMIAESRRILAGGEGVRA